MIGLFIAFAIGAGAGFGVGRIKDAKKLAAIQSTIDSFESQVVNGTIGVAITKVLGDIKSKI